MSISQPLRKEAMEFEYTCDVCGVNRYIPIPDDEWQLFLEMVSPHPEKFKVRCPRCTGIHEVGTGGFVRPKPKERVDPKTEKIRTWIPLIYQESDIERYPKKIWETFKHWVPGPNGLIFYGPHRRFKSRIAYSIAAHHIDIGTEVECYDARSFRAMIERRISEKSLWSWYEKGARAPCFLLDDLGKFKAEGRRIEEEIYNLVKLRHEAKLGMLITTNCSINDLAATFTPSIGIAVTERLRELCKPIPFLTQDELTQDAKVSHLDPRKADL